MHDRNEAVWLIAAKRVAKTLKRSPDTGDVLPVYHELLAKFTEPDGTVNTKKKVFAFPGLPYPFPEVPGLILREMNSADVETIIPLMAYPTPEAARVGVAYRFNDPFTQTLAWEFRGQLLQTEAFTLHPDGLAESAISVHNSKRSAAFWREAERPVFERLQALGVTGLKAIVLRNLVSFWQPLLVNVYHAVVSDDTREKTVEFRYPVDLSVFKGWNTRITAGADWSYAYKDLSFREMRADELKSTMQAVQKMHKTANGEKAAQLLEEAYLLDRAAVLLGFKNGELFTVRSVRPHSRQAGRGNYAIYNSLKNTPDQHAAVYASAVWYRALGFSRVTIFATQEQVEHPSIRAYMDKENQAQQIFEFVDRGIKKYVLATSVDVVLSKTIEEWTA